MKVTKSGVEFVAFLSDVCGPGESREPQVSDSVRGWDWDVVEENRWTIAATEGKRYMNALALIKLYSPPRTPFSNGIEVEL